MGTLQGEWNHLQWQLDPYKWYLHSDTLFRHGRRHNGGHFKLLPQKYENRYCLRAMRYLSNEGMLGFMIFLVICITLYMHTFMLDTSRNFYLPTDARIQYRQKVRVMIAVVTHHPSRYLKTTLKSLNSSQHDADVFVFRNFVADDVYKNVLRWYPSAMVVPDKERLKGTSIMKFVMDRFIFSKYDVLMIINSYSILCVKWWDILMDGLENSKGIFSLYGMERQIEEMERCENLLCRQSWIGWIGSVWRRNLATRMISETLNEKGVFQYKMENWCKLKNVTMHSVKYSAINILDNERTFNGTLQKWTDPQQYRYKRFDSVSKNTNTENNGKHTSIDQITSICIAAVVRVRISRDDRAKMTAFELEQWIRYMQFAGVNVVYFYDSFERGDEKLYAWVKDIFDQDEVVYHNWHYNGSYDIRESIRSAYRHATRKYKYNCAWHIHANMDEYPFLANDTDTDFLKRLIVKMRSLKKTINEISIPIFQFTDNETKDPILIWRRHSRYKNRVPGEARPLFLACSVKKTHLFHNKLENGDTIFMDPNLVRIHRYELINDDKSISDKVITDMSMFPLYEYMKQYNFLSNKLPLYAINQFWDS